MAEAEAEEEEPVVESAALCVEGLEGTCWADQFASLTQTIYLENRQKIHECDHQNHRIAWVIRWCVHHVWHCVPEYLKTA